MRQSRHRLFITFATAIAMVGREYVAGAMVMTIILVAQFIAELNTVRTALRRPRLVPFRPRPRDVGGADISRSV